MDFATYLKTATVDFFKSFTKSEPCQRIAQIVSEAGMDFGFDRTGNITDHRSQLSELRGTATSRVSLDKYLDGTHSIVVNRMQAVDAGHVFLSAIHGAIKLWRRVDGQRTADGKERLLDDDFTATAQYVGLIKVVDKKPVYKDGVQQFNADGTPKTANIANSNGRVWFGANASLEALVAAFTAAAPPLPTGYVGTEAKNVVGTILLPCAIWTRSGKKMGNNYIRIGSYTAAETKLAKGEAKSNLSLDTFVEFVANPDYEFDTKNKGYKLLASLCDARRAKLIETLPVIDRPADYVPPVAEPVEAPKPHAKSKKAA